MSNLFWLHVVLVHIPVSDLKLLLERGREAPTIRTRVISCVRHPGREPRGDFGISRVGVHPQDAAMTLMWTEKLVGRRSAPKSRDAPLKRHVVISLGGHCVIAQSFLVETEAHTWASERHETPVPK